MQMAYESKGAACAAAEEVLSQAQCSDEVIAAVVAKLVDPAVTVEDITILLAGPRAVGKLKAFAGEQAGCLLHPYQSAVVMSMGGGRAAGGPGRWGFCVQGCNCKGAAVCPCAWTPGAAGVCYCCATVTVTSQ